MVLTGENRSTERKTFISATTFATNVTETDLESNPGV